MRLAFVKKEKIKTERLTLQPYRTEDLDDLVKILKNEEVAKTFMIPEYETEPQFVTLATKLIGFSQIEDEAHLEYGIYLDGKLIGFVNDCDVEDDVVEIGYVIHPDYKNNGYVTEAVKAVIGELKEMGFSKVVAGCFAENEASFRVMQKCGMTETDYVDEVEYRGKTHVCHYCEISLTDGDY